MKWNILRYFIQSGKEVPDNTRLGGGMRGKQARTEFHMSFLKRT